MDFSELRRARERLGLSLRDIADRTKIRTGILDAIERHEIERLPPPIFTRAFVKAYAREVGLDPQAFAEPKLTSQPVAAASSPQIVEDRADQYNLAEGNSSNLVTAALIVIVGLLFVLTDPWKASTPANESTPLAADAASSHGTATETAVATTGAELPGVSATPQHANLRMELVPQGPCWVEATADGARVIYKLLNAGDRYALEGYDDLVLRVGDPAALAFTIDGVIGRPLGPAGQPTTVHITRENHREFVVGS